MLQRRQKADGGAKFTGHAKRNKATVARGDADNQRALMPCQQRDQRHGDQSAKKDRLIDRHAAENGFHQPVIQDEGQHAQRHQSGAFKIFVAENHATDGVPTGRYCHAEYRACGYRQGVTLRAACRNLLGRILPCNKL